MDDTVPKAALSAPSGWYEPDLAVEPRPPYQMRGVTEIFIVGQMPPESAGRLLPKGLRMRPGGLFAMAVYDAPEGWGPVPYRQFTLSIEVDGYDTVDGRPADFLLTGTTSGRAGDIFGRDYSAHFHKADIAFDATDATVTAEVPLEGGNAMLRMSGRRVDETPGTNAGVISVIGPDGAEGLNIYSVGYSLSFTSLSDISLDIDVPQGHRLGVLRDLKPDWGLYFWDKAISISAPQPLEEVFGDVPNRMAFLDTLSRMGRAVAIVEQTGRLAYATAEAETLLSVAAGPAPTRLPAAVTRSILANPMANSLWNAGRQPTIITLPSGRQLAARAFPIALRLGTGPLAMVLLTDPRAPGPTDPEPLLRLMGLTPSEAALASLVGQGHSPAEAAALRGITASTARSMLKSVYPKLGLTRQSELAILITRLQSA